MTANELMIKIDIPTDFSECVNAYLDSVDISEFESIILMMLNTSKRDEGYRAAIAEIGDDPRGIKIFAIEITAAARAYDAYAALGISDEIYFDTMRAFRRQLNESYTEERGWIFDRGFWDVHQTSLTLFRIGELEYAFANKYNEDILAIHIPSDAALTDENMDASFAAAREFFKKYYPKAAKRRFTCGTWLLSRNLRKLLPEDSKIRKFQDKFYFERDLAGDAGVLRWMFGVTKPISEIDLTVLSEKTSLQRKVKEKLIAGETIGQAYGIYKEGIDDGNIRIGKYRHYKGGLYEVIALGKHSETLEELVVYRALYGEGGVWVRPAYMWSQMVTLENDTVRRFEYIED